jgi:hypothetical protein
MRRSRLVQLVGAAALAASLLVPSTAAAGAPSAGGTDPVATRTTPVSLPAIKLDCSLAVQNPLGPAKPHRAIVCRWVAPEGVTVKAYRLWRTVDAPKGHRRLIATVAADGVLRHVDARIARNHNYSYVVAAIGADGSRVAVSKRVTVHVGRPVQALHMGCAIVSVRGNDAVSCRWSATSRPAAIAYELIRSVDGAPRQVIYRTSLSGWRHFVDTDVKAGQKVRYAVLAVAAGGRVVGLAGPVKILVPALSATAGSATAR